MKSNINPGSIDLVSVIHDALRDLRYLQVGVEGLIRAQRPGGDQTHERGAQEHIHGLARGHRPHFREERAGCPEQRGVHADILDT